MIRWARKYHKWLMAFVGIQFLFWSVTGMYMVSMDIHFIHGEPLAKSEPSRLELATVRYSVKELAAAFPGAQAIRLSQSMGKPVYTFTDGENGKQAVNALTGELLPLVDETRAKAIARFYYAQQHEIDSLLLITQADAMSAELSPRHLPVWQVTFDADATPTFYINQHTGAIVTKRHDYWRLFDWMWRFHIMDYDDGENVANWFLLLIASLGLLAAISGAMLTYVRVFKAKHRRHHVLSVLKSNPAIHKWVSVIVGLQLFIWLGTGLYFNLMDHDKARGNAYRVHAHHEGSVADYDLMPVSELRVDAPSEIRLIWLLHQPYYHVIYQQGQHAYQLRDSALHDAVTGQVFSLSAEQALQLAQQSYSGPGTLGHAELKQAPFSDYVRQQNPMWQVQAQDDNNTSIYLDAVTGQVLRHANDDFRLKDLMFKLHFMDYGNTGGFNHWLIICFAIATLLLSITGVTWLVQLYQKGQLRFRL